MTQTNVSTKAAIAAKHWEGQDVTDLLSTSAAALPAISATEAGTQGRSIAFTATEHASPINLGGGIPDPDSLPVAGLQAAVNRVFETTSEPALPLWGHLRVRRPSAGVGRPARAHSGHQTRLRELPVDPRRLRRHRRGVRHLPQPRRRRDCRAAAPSRARCGRFVATCARWSRSTWARTTPSPIGWRRRCRGSRQRASTPSCCTRCRTTTTQPARPCRWPCGRSWWRSARSTGSSSWRTWPYTELYFDAPPPPSLYAVADGHGVIQVGSFSKVIATGLRVGWIQARLPVIESVGRVRFDMGGSPLLHRALADYVGNGELEPHVEILRGIYRRKCETLVATLREHCEPYLRFTDPEGGFFLWAECFGASAQDVAREAAIEGVTFAAGSNFYATARGGGHVAHPAGAELRGDRGAGGRGPAAATGIPARGGLGADEVASLGDDAKLGFRGLG